MKKTHLVGIILIFSVGCGHHSIDSLDNTIWLNDKHDDCTSRLEFTTEGNLKTYYCALDEYFDAQYDIKEDTIIISEYHLISQAPGSSEEKEIRFVYKYILESNKLVQVYYDDLKHPNPEIGRNESFTFVKAK